MFFDRMDKGYNIDGAVNDIMKFHYDYSDLTDFEKTYMKAIFPFYTWTRKNLPLQLEMMITNPGKLSTVHDFQEAVQVSAGWDDSDINYNQLPSWIQEASPLFVGYNQDGTARFAKLE